MDALAISIAYGLNFNRPNWKLAIRIGLYFGLFQGGMTLLGYWLGASVTNMISNIANWVAFILLSYVGIKMFIDGFKEEKVSNDFSNKKLAYLAIATSIDALAVGVGMALAKDGTILTASIIIAIVTYILSFIGVIIGSYIGSKYEKYACFLGGIILFGMGVKALADGFM